MQTPWWDKSRLTQRRENLAIRSQITAGVRQFFLERGFSEVDTPVLQVSPGLDRHVRPLRTTLAGPFQNDGVPRYLHTSPEFSMKKLLAAGETDIFQICHVFRDGEDSKAHHPEFTLLEWYRAGATYDALMTDVADLIAGVARHIGRTNLQYEDRVAAAESDWTRYTIAEALLEFAGIDVLATLDGDGLPSSEALAQAALTAGIRCDVNAAWEDTFHHILLERVEPRLAAQGKAFLTDYPTPAGALARRKPTDPRVCERVEAYVCGMELANGFSELTDPVEQRARFEEDRAVHEALYGPAPPIDEEFLAALAHLPPSAGMALGLDRLVMLFTGADHIRDVLWAPVDVPNGG